MPQEAPSADPTLALNTTLEREFVSPLTSVRGALEILRDFPDLSAEERSRFLDNALQGCARLELAVEQLASSVYTADKQQAEEPEAQQPTDDSSEYLDRIKFLTEQQIIEVDFSNYVFTSSKSVNDFYDQLDEMIEASGERWFILVNYHQCRIWPEAWIAFAHRGKKVNVSYSLGTVRYFDASADDGESAMLSDPELFTSREEALAHIESLRKTG